MNTLGIGFRVSNTIRGKVRFGFPFEGTWRLSICQIVDMVKLERAPEVASADIGGFSPALSVFYRTMVSFPTVRSE